MAGRLRQHVVEGTRREHAADGADAAGGGRDIRGLGGEARRARSGAMRDAVRDGAWDAEAVCRAFMGSGARLFSAAGWRAESIGRCVNDGSAFVVARWTPKLHPRASR